MSEPEVIDSNESPEAEPRLDLRERLLALGFDISKRAAVLRSLSDLYLFLVNDLQAFIEFDRCFLIVHMGGRSRVVAMNHQPSLEKKSQLFTQMNNLAPGVKHMVKGVLLSRDVGDSDFEKQGIGEDLKEVLRLYVDSSGCNYFLCVPLLHNDVPVCHLVCEFFGERAPHRLGIMALLDAGPLLASMLVEKWLLEERPEMAALMDPARRRRRVTFEFVTRFGPFLGVGFIVLLWLLFLFPFNHTVGGEAAIVPWERHVAFCKIEGLIDKVMVKEGSAVAKESVLATLDTKEIDYRIAKAEREAEIMTKQIERLTFQADSTPSKLGERKIIELERAKKREELKFFKWQWQFLEIKAAVTGIIVTKDVESLAGKRLNAGEPFCEIAVPGDLAAEILVPDSKVPLVKKGQTAYVYLNNNPLKGYRLEVGEIAPAAEVVARHGNICRVRARFPDAPRSVMVGMTGIGKISTEETRLWSVITQGILLRWNQLSLHF